MTRLEFVVYGKPQPGGSKRIVPSGRPGGRSHLTADNPSVRQWMDRVAAEAGEAMDGGALLEGALTLVARFYVVRPQGHFGTGRNAGALRASAPEHPTTRPDVTKLVRAVEDALKGVVWRDDAQVVWQTTSKQYGEPARVEVEVAAVVPFDR